ncbi:MAG: hypothetical protein IPK82_07620 [Polyangiaceae bacterium]|nr:hypothetical protein [Polyangiaceae bacterium]
MTRRWEPAYDAESLTQEIGRLAAAVQGQTYPFYTLTMVGPPFCQGDIVELGVDVPCIDEDGEAAALAAPSRFWMLVGNTCDHARELSHVPWTQAVPLEARARSEAPAAVLREQLEYRHARRFYVPTWPSGGDGTTMFWADFLRIVPVHRKALKPGMLRARLTKEAWYLLHACLIRFLARDDGRED